MEFKPRPVVLEGQHVRLEPLETRHAAAIFEAGRDPEIFRWFLDPPLAVPADAEKWVAAALASQAAGIDVCFVTIRLRDSRVVGSTRFLDLRLAHRTLEIGNTWISRDAQRTPVNTEAKYLMLRHAFETLGAVRVQLKTDKRNEPSRRAIARLGAVEEGILRKYQTRFDGYVRDTVMFSITSDEWRGVKTRLESMVARPDGTAAGTRLS
ncbi:MAG TPA: GNAT family protein [Candidatus Didemnitutus sp.]|nr:GNAT family protein [Candidatus Didemnitutus sp.]